MLDWLKRRGNREELPEYSALRSVPTRALPPDLAEQEASEAFAAHRQAVRRELDERPRRPADDTPLFVQLVAARGVLTISPPDNDGPCLPIFSTPFGASDYIRTVLSRGPSLKYLVSSPLEFVGMLGDLEGSGIKRFALDRCPRCTVFTVIETGSVKTADDAIVIWSVSKASQLARLDLYLDYARRAARTGRLDIARDVALETVGHVSSDDPRPHLLLGQLAVAVGDRRLLDEARAFLQFLKLDRCERQLDRAIRSGSSDFEEAE